MAVKERHPHGIRAAGAHWPAGLLLLCWLGLYAQTLEHPFINWDDPQHIYRNPSVTRPQELTWQERWFPRHLGYPMPLTLATYRLDRWAWGLDLAPAQGRLFHRSQLAFALGLLLVYYLLALALLAHPWAAAAALALVAFHPLAVEPLCWLSGRKDLLCALMVLAALLAWWRHLGRRRGAGAASAGLFLLLGLLALLSKPTALFLPPLATYLLLLRRRMAPPRRGPRRPAWASLTSLTLLGLAALGTLIWSFRWNRAVGGLEAGVAAGATLRRAVWALGYHLHLLGAPFELRAKYIVAPPGHLDTHDLLGALGLATATLLLWPLVRKHPRSRGATSPGSSAAAPPRVTGGAAAAGLALAVFGYIPVSNLVPLRRFIADTYLLFPLLGLGLAAGAGLRLLLTRPGVRPLLRRGALVTGTLLVLLFALASDRQLSIRSSSARLWAHTMGFHPDSPQVCRQYGHAHNEHGRHRRALDIYRRCSARFGVELFAANMAISHFLLGEYEPADRLFSEVLRRNPKDLRARRYLTRIRQK